jgi:type II secretory pathway predicted ATPase ExeA
MGRSGMLATEQVERGRTPVLVIDEAHLLDHAQLEAIRMLTNHDLDFPQPVRLFAHRATHLAPTNETRRASRPRPTHRTALRHAPMTAEETASYLRHHLALAGRSDTLFSDDATALIHQTSRGYPRAVNNIALQALVAAFAADKAIVDEKSARTTVAEVTAE